MARSTSDEEIKLRKRARRRLIGAIALTTLVVVALPMILDSEPRPIGDNVAVDIPSPNVGPFAPKPAPVQPAKASRPETSAPSVREADKSAAPEPLQQVPAAPEPSQQVPAAPAARPAAAPTAQASGAIASAAAPGDMNIAIAGALKPPAESASAGTQRPATVAAVPALKSEAAKAEVTKAEVTKADTAKSEVTKADAAKADAAKAAADKGAKGVENFVIQLGAFAEVDRAKDRHAQLVKAGIRSYTEVIKTPTGDKTRVRAGPFPSKEAADKINERLKTLGMADGVVVPRRY
jgi:DedD protein